MSRKIAQTVIATALGLIVTGALSPAQASNGHVGTVLYWDANFSGPQAAIECGQSVFNLGLQWAGFSMNDRMTSVKTYNCLCIYYVDADMGGLSFGLNANTSRSNVGSTWNDKISSVLC